MNITEMKGMIGKHEKSMSEIHELVGQKMSYKESIGDVKLEERKFDEETKNLMMKVKLMRFLLTKKDTIEEIKQNQESLTTLKKEYEEKATANLQDQNEAEYQIEKAKKNIENYNRRTQHLVEKFMRIQTKFDRFVERFKQRGKKNPRGLIHPRLHDAKKDQAKRFIKSGTTSVANMRKKLNIPKPKKKKKTRVDLSAMEAEFDFQTETLANVHQVKMENLIQELYQLKLS